MEFRFELPDGYSLRDMLAFVKVHYRKNKIRRLQDLLICLFVIIMAGVLILSIIFGMDSDLDIKPAWNILPLILLCIFCFLISDIFNYLIAWLVWRQEAKNISPVCVCLNDDGLTLKSPKGTEVRPYSAFTKAWVYKEYWLLFLDKHHAEILPRSAMTVGDPDAFPAFWAEKTGIPIKKFK